MVTFQENVSTIYMPYDSNMGTQVIDNNTFDNITFDNIMFDNITFDNITFDNITFDNISFGNSSWFVKSMLDNINFYNSTNDSIGLENSTLDNNSFSLPLPIKNCSYLTTTPNSTAGAQAMHLLFVVKQYIGPPLLLFGIVTNILTLLTLQNPKLKESPYVHLTALTVADLLALVFIFIEDISTVSYYGSLYIAHIYYPLTNVAETFGIWVMVTMTLERCLFVQFPLWAPIRCTVRLARIRIVVIFVVSFVYNTPRFVWYQIEWCLDHSKQPSVIPDIRQALNPDHTAAIVITWIYSTCSNFVPLLSLLVLNSFLIYKVHSQQRRRAKLGIAKNSETVWSREQTRLTLTFIAIVFLFLVLVFPSAFVHPSIILPMFGLDKINHWVSIAQHVSNMLVWLNLSVNFLLYTFINSKFLQAFKAMVFRWRRVVTLCATVLRRRLQRKRKGRQLQKQSSFAISLQQETFSFNMASV